MGESGGLTSAVSCARIIRYANIYSTASRQNDNFSRQFLDDGNILSLSAQICRVNKTVNRPGDFVLMSDLG